jgi:signal peptidase I
LSRAFFFLRWFILGLLVPGAGFWRAGKPHLAFAAWMVLLPLPASVLLVSLAPRKFVWLMLFAVLAWVVASLVSAFLGARAARTPVVGWKPVLVFCFGVLVFNSLMSEAVSWRLKPFNTPSESMSPSLLKGDQFYAMNDRVRFPVERGAVIVHADPSSGFDYVRRVIGLEGDIVEWDGETLFINGTPLAKGACESDAPVPCHTEQLGTRKWRVRSDGASSSRGRWEVPAGSMFVMGDNRSNSLDSRHSGPFSLASVKGVAEVIHFSWPDVTRSGRPIDLAR